MKRYLLLPIIFLLAFTTSDNKSNYNIPIRPTSIYTIDFDLDDDQDIIVGHLTNMGYTNPSITLMRNNGQGHFSIFDSSYTYLGYQYDIFSRNLYGDQYPEIVTVFFESEKNKSGSYLRILKMDTTGIIGYSDYFTSINYSFDYKTYGDINGDGDIDIIIASYDCQCWGILYNQGEGNFSEPEYYYTEFPPTDVSCENLNNDSFDDIVIGGADVNIYLSNGSGFDEIIFTNGSWDVFIDDFDNDGDNDIVGIDGMYTWNYFSYIENSGNNNFIQHPDTTTHPGCLDFYLSDLDNDGLKEILGLSNNLSGIYIFYNKGNFHIQDPVFIAIDYYGEETRRLRCDDLDGNGYNDIIVVRRHGIPLPANLKILFNDGNGNFIDDPITNIPNTEVATQNLLSCFPNPIQSHATIKFNLSKPSTIELILMDNSGRIINYLLSNKFFQAGIHTVPMNVSTLPKGIYYLKMNDNEVHLQSLKIIIN